MEKYELNNIQFALEMNWRKKLGVAILATPAAHGASVFLKDDHNAGRKLPLFAHLIFLSLKQNRTSSKSFFNIFSNKNFRK